MPWNPADALQQAELADENGKRVKPVQKLDVPATPSATPAVPAQPSVAPAPIPKPVAKPVQPSKPDPVVKPVRDIVPGVYGAEKPKKVSDVKESPGPTEPLTAESLYNDDVYAVYQGLYGHYDVMAYDRDLHLAADAYQKPPVQWTGEQIEAVNRIDHAEARHQGNIEKKNRALEKIQAAGRKEFLREFPHVKPMGNLAIRPRDGNPEDFGWSELVDDLRVAAYEDARLKYDYAYKFEQTDKGRRPVVNHVNKVIAEHAARMGLDPLEYTDAALRADLPVWFAVGALQDHADKTFREWRDKYDQAEGQRDPTETTARFQTMPEIPAVGSMPSTAEINKAAVKYGSYGVLPAEQAKEYYDRKKAQLTKEAEGNRTMSLGIMSATSGVEEARREGAPADVIEYKQQLLDRLVRKRLGLVMGHPVVVGSTWTGGTPADSALTSTSLAVMNAGNIIETVDTMTGGGAAELAETYGYVASGFGDYVTKFTTMIAETIGTDVTKLTPDQRDDIKEIAYLYAAAKKNNGQWTGLISLPYTLGLTSDDKESWKTAFAPRYEVIGLSPSNGMITRIESPIAYAVNVGFGIPTAAVTADVRTKPNPVMRIVPLTRFFNTGAPLPLPEPPSVDDEAGTDLDTEPFRNPVTQDIGDAFIEGLANRESVLGYGFENVLANDYSTAETIGIMTSALVLEVVIPGGPEYAPGLWSRALSGGRLARGAVIRNAPEIMARIVFPIEEWVGRLTGSIQAAVLPHLDGIARFGTLSQTATNEGVRLGRLADEADAAGDAVKATDLRDRSVDLFDKAEKYARAQEVSEARLRSLRPAEEKIADEMKALDKEAADIRASNLSQEEKIERIAAVDARRAAPTDAGGQYIGDELDRVHTTLEMDDQVNLAHLSPDPEVRRAAFDVTNKNLARAAKGLPEDAAKVLGDELTSLAPGYVRAATTASTGDMSAGYSGVFGTARKIANIRKARTLVKAKIAAGEIVPKAVTETVDDWRNLAKDHIRGLEALAKQGEGTPLAPAIRRALANAVEGFDDEAAFLTWMNRADKEIRAGLDELVRIRGDAKVKMANGNPLTKDEKRIAGYKDSTIAEMPDRAASLLVKAGGAMEEAWLRAHPERLLDRMEAAVLWDRARRAHAAAAVAEALRFYGVAASILPPEALGPLTARATSRTGSFHRYLRESLAAARAGFIREGALSEGAADARDAFVRYFGMTRKEAHAEARIVDAHAHAWAAETGRPISAFYEEVFAGVMGPDDVVSDAANTLHVDRPDLFYSELRNAAEQRLPNLASPDQIRGMLSKGTKSEERVWTELDTFLDEAEATGRKSIPKKEVLDWLDQHAVKIEETVYGGQSLRPELARAVSNSVTLPALDARERHALIAALRVEGSLANEARGIRSYADSRLTRLIAERAGLDMLSKNADEATNAVIVGTRFVTALREPDVMAMDEFDAISHVAKKLGYPAEYVIELTNDHDVAREVLRLQSVEKLLNPSEETVKLWDEFASSTEPRWSSHVVPGEHKNYSERLITLPTRPDVQPFLSDHWREVENVLVHTRTTERVDEAGRTLLHVDEIQSDWQQAARIRGTTPEDNAAKLVKYEAEYERARQAVVDSARDTIEQWRWSDISNGRTRLVVNADGSGISQRITAERLPNNKIRLYFSGGSVTSFDSFDEALRSVKESTLARQYVSFASADTVRETSRFARVIDDVRQGPVPPAPFRSTWSDLALKRLLRLAADDPNLDGLALARGEDIADIVGGKVEGQKKFYNEILVKKLDALVKQKGGKGVGMTAVRYGDNVVEVPFVEMTPHLRKQFSKPQALLSGGKAVDTPAVAGKVKVAPKGKHIRDPSVDLLERVEDLPTKPSERTLAEAEYEETDPGLFRYGDGRYSLFSGGPAKPPVKAPTIDDLVLSMTEDLAEFRKRASAGKKLATAREADPWVGMPDEFDIDVDVKDLWKDIPDEFEREILPTRVVFAETGDKAVDARLKAMARLLDKANILIARGGPKRVATGQAIAERLNSMAEAVQAGRWADAADDAVKDLADLFEVRLPKGSFDGTVPVRVDPLDAPLLSADPGTAARAAALADLRPMAATMGGVAGRRVTRLIADLEERLLTRTWTAANDETLHTVADVVGSPLSPSVTADPVVPLTKIEGAESARQAEMAAARNAYLKDNPWAAIPDEFIIDNKPNLFFDFPSKTAPIVGTLSVGGDLPANTRVVVLPGAFPRPSGPGGAARMAVLEDLVLLAAQKEAAVDDLAPAADMVEAYERANAKKAYGVLADRLGAMSGSLYVGNWSSSADEAIRTAGFVLEREVPEATFRLPAVEMTEPVTVDKGLKIGTKLPGPVEPNELKRTHIPIFVRPERVEAIKAAKLKRQRTQTISGLRKLLVAEPGETREVRLSEAAAKWLDSAEVRNANDQWSEADQQLLEKLAERLRGKHGRRIPPFKPDGSGPSRPIGQISESVSQIPEVEKTALTAVEESLVQHELERVRTGRTTLFSRSGGTPVAATHLMDNGSVIIQALSRDATVEDLVHEIAHVLRQYLPEARQAEIVAWMQNNGHRVDLVAGRLVRTDDVEIAKQVNDVLNAALDDLGDKRIRLAEVEEILSGKRSTKGKKLGPYHQAKQTPLTPDQKALFEAEKKYLTTKIDDLDRRLQRTKKGVAARLGVWTDPGTGRRGIHPELRAAEEAWAEAVVAEIRSGGPINEETYGSVAPALRATRRQLAHVANVVLRESDVYKPASAVEDVLRKSFRSFIEPITMPAVDTGLADVPPVAVRLSRAAKEEAGIDMTSDEILDKLVQEPYAIEFPQPVMGKTRWTADDVIRMDDRRASLGVVAGRLPEGGPEIPVAVNEAAAGRTLPSPPIVSTAEGVTESRIEQMIYQQWRALADNPMAYNDPMSTSAHAVAGAGLGTAVGSLGGPVGAGLGGFAGAALGIPVGPHVSKAFGRAATFFMFGSDIQNRAMRHLPPVVRLGVNSIQREVSIAMADSSRFAVEATEFYDGDLSDFFRYLGGEDVTFREGRSVASKGVNRIEVVADSLQRSWAGLPKPVKSTLIRAAYDLAEGERLAKADWRPAEDLIREHKYAKQIGEAIRTLISGETTKGKKLPGGPNRFLSDVMDGVRNSDATKLTPQDQIAVIQMLQEAGVLDLVFSDAQITNIAIGRTAAETAQAVVGAAAFGKSGTAADIVRTHAAVILGVHGSLGNVGKLAWDLGLGVPTKVAQHFSAWVHGEAVPAEMLPQMRQLAQRFGFSPRFTELLGTGERGLSVPGAVDDIIYGPSGELEMARQALITAQNVGAYKNASDYAKAVFRYIVVRQVSGGVLPRARYYFMNTLLDPVQTASALGVSVAARSAVRTLPQLVAPALTHAAHYVSRLAEKAGVDAVPFEEGLRRGLQAAGDFLGSGIGKMIQAAPYDVRVNAILMGDPTPIRFGDRLISGRELLEIARQEGMFSGQDVSLLQKSIEGLMAGDAKPRGRAWWRQGGRASTWIFRDMFRVTRDAAEAWGERQRLGLMATLIESGTDPRLAARTANVVLFDYAGTSGDLGNIPGARWLFKGLQPYWTWVKNASRLFANLLADPETAYRTMVMARIGYRGPEALSMAAFAAMTDPYGVDADSLDFAGQSYYWTTRTFIEWGLGHEDGWPDNVKQWVVNNYADKVNPPFKPGESPSFDDVWVRMQPTHRQLLRYGYGGPENVPDDVRAGLTMMFSDRSFTYDHGRAWRLDDSLIPQTSAVGPVGAPTAAGAMSYLDRTAMSDWSASSSFFAMPSLPKNSPFYPNVGRYLASLPGDERALAFILPDSFQMATMKQGAGGAAMMYNVGAAFALMAAGESELAGAIDISRPLDDYVSLDRTMLISDVLAAMGVTEGRPLRLHNKFGRNMVNMPGVSMFVRKVPGKTITEGPEAGRTVIDDRYYIDAPLAAALFKYLPPGEANDWMIKGVAETAYEQALIADVEVPGVSLAEAAAMLRLASIVTGTGPTEISHKKAGEQATPRRTIEVQGLEPPPR